MPNIFKRFSSLVKAEPYQFPSADDWAAEEEERRARQAEAEQDDSPGWEQPEESEDMEPVPRREPEAEEEETETSPVAFAQVQADAILRDARRDAEDIVAKARLDAELEKERIREAAREEGRMAGYTEGLNLGRLDASRELEERADAQEAAVQEFLERVGAELDRKLDESVNDLRDLAMAIAEKVVCVSLQSSSDVICRMIQTAIDKKKRREWVHIYIAERDAKRLGQIPASLSASLSALSGRVRIIPMAADESGTCIIETPDEIIDASASTQLNNIRGLLLDAAAGTGDLSLY